MVAILVLQALGAVDHEHAHIGRVDGAARTQRRIELHAIVDSRLTTQAGRVHEDEIGLLVAHGRIDGIAGRPGLIAHHQPFFTKEAVHEARLPHIRPSDDRHTNGLGAFFAGFGNGVDHGIEQIARALAVRRGDRVHVRHPESIELVEVGALGVVDLVGHEQPRLLRIPQQVHDAGVTGVHPHLGVAHEEHEVRLFNRLHDLVANGEIHGQIGILDEPAGIDEPEVVPRPLGLAEVPIARGARLVTDDGGGLTDDAVEEMRLAHVGATDNGNDGETHA
jgi:hypothetical protein